jgi:hypothetical protein
MGKKPIVKQRAASDTEQEVFNLGGNVVRHPSGQCFGHLLFVILINDIDEAVVQVEMIKKFAYNTKVGQTVTIVEEKETLQAAQGVPCGSATTGGMKFNISKCKIMHVE